MNPFHTTEKYERYLEHTFVNSLVGPLTQKGVQGCRD